MLLHYFKKYFLEEREFVTSCDVDVEELRRLIAARVFPEPSHIYSAKGNCTSFFGDHAHCEDYRFHLRGHTDWFQSVSRFGLDTEERARAHFDACYNQAKKMFVSSRLGRDLAALAPDVLPTFDPIKAASTWVHFLNGVYGTCTTDGQPETVFLKQAGVMYIEQITANGPGALSSHALEVLDRAVLFLDKIESPFAPHEVPHSSRQRCINDVRRDFLTTSDQNMK